MAIAHSKVTSQGQVSVPASVRRMLGIGPGSVLEWSSDGETAIVRRASRYSSKDIHKALFSARPKPRSLEELKEGIRTHMRRKHARR